jgi:hypothetical protein
MTLPCLPRFVSDDRVLLMCGTARASTAKPGRPPQAIHSETQDARGHVTYCDTRKFGSAVETTCR